MLPLLLVLFLLLPAAEAKNLDDPVLANNNFGFKLLQELTNKDKKATNIFISPLSIGEVLKMSVNGAAGKTKDEIVSVLNLTDNNTQNINTADRTLVATITAPNKALASTVTQGDPNFHLNIANSLWGDKKIQFNPAFIDVCKSNYQAQVEALDFANPQSLNIINSWISGKTKGKIPRMLNQLSAADLLLLVNATYFKAPWENVFDKSSTQLIDFQASSGQITKCPTMHRSGRMAYLKNSTGEMINLPYADKQTSMYVLLPAKGKSAFDLLPTLSAKNWQSLTGSLSARPGEIYLPKFKFAYDSRLKSPLMNLGMKTPFDKQAADFSPMTKTVQHIWVGDVLHKTFVDVNEEGTEAAAVTVMTMCGSAMPPPETPFVMKVDRPFIFAIVNNSTKTIIFIGLVGDPTKS
ncbi:MAG: serpin family protein [Candidatus Obscuribacterales bacterium]|nr:serpin family protein [Candidatus Obscuribacterales bacterium]